MDRLHWRWVWINAVGATAAINVVLNSLIAWLSVRGMDEVPVWALPFAAICFAALTPIALVALFAADPGAISSGAFVTYKIVLGVGLGLVVSPLVAIGAMAERPPDPHPGLPNGRSARPDRRAPPP